MDNKGAVREQHCGESNNRPGDIYHPDFMLGKPAYFDVSVRNSLQPHYILRAAVEAGAAKEAGEIEKDERHEQEVVDAGGIFFPLVVETLALWSPNSLKVLTSIASKASSLSGIPCHQAISNLLQQLLVHLWTFNARMVHARIEMEGVNVRDWNLPTTTS